MKIPDNVINFLLNQGFVIISSIDNNGFPHAACKGIVSMTKEGKVYIFDLYRAQTLENLKKNPRASITAVDEHSFSGFCLKGRARALHDKELSDELVQAWDARITSRLTQRLLKNLHEEKGHPRHPEALLPNPEYLIEIEVEEIVDLTPKHLK